MNLFFSVSSTIIAVLLTIHITGCESSDDNEEVQGAILQSAVPPEASALPANGTITLYFDNDPKYIIVQASNGKVGRAVISYETVTINGPFTQGELAFIIIWAGGEQTLNYTVTAPEVPFKRH